jgi:hypothetical protein
LGKIAGALRRRQCAGAPRDLCLAGRQWRRDRIKPCNDTFDIAVDRHGRLVEGDRGNGRRRIAADSGQFPQGGFTFRELAAMPRHEDPRAGVHVAGARVIAEPGPGGEHVVQRGRRQCRQIGPTLQEFRVIERDCSHRRLLQHDLGQPDAVGIRAFTCRRPPRQHAAVPVIPGEQVGGPRLSPAFRARQGRRQA